MKQTKPALEDEHEVIGDEGVVLRLYACRREPWAEHGGKAAHGDGKSYVAVEGIDAPHRPFHEMCRVGMKGAHVCLRVLHDKGQEKLAEGWLKRLGAPIPSEL